MNNKKYKATFILDTRGYNEPVETLVEKIKSVIESANCKIQAVENLGQKTFARTTDRSFPAGIYVEVSFEGPATANSVIKEKLRLDKTVNRVLVMAE
jgi:ribosomal protein S6